MIIDISNSQFKQIFNDERLYLPIRWAGDDFASVLEELYHLYQKRIDKLHKKEADIEIERINFPGASTKVSTGHFTLALLGQGICPTRINPPLRAPSRQAAGY